MDEDSVIIPLLNGMQHLDMLRKRLGTPTVFGGVAHLMSTLDENARIRHLSKIHEMRYGPLDGVPSCALDRVDGALRGSGFDAVKSLTIMQDMWEKWVFLASLGAITCLMRGTVGDVEAVSGGRAFAEGVLGEAASVAAANGHTIEQEVLTHIRETLTEHGSGAQSSMYRDLLERRRVEAEQILGDMVTRAESFQVSTPLLRLALLNLAIYAKSLSSDQVT